MAVLTMSVNLEWHLFALLILLTRFMKTLLIRNWYLPAQSYLSFCSRLRSYWGPVLTSGVSSLEMSGVG